MSAEVASALWRFRPRRAATGYRPPWRSRPRPELANAGAAILQPPPARRVPAAPAHRATAGRPGTLPVRPRKLTGPAPPQDTGQSPRLPPSRRPTFAQLGALTKDHERSIGTA